MAHRITCRQIFRPRTRVILTIIENESKQHKKTQNYK